MNSNNWFNNNWFKEANSAKEQALSLLGDKSKLQEIKQLVSRTQKPFRHYSYVSYLISKNTPIDSINQVINEVEKLLNENKLQNILANQSGITVIDARGNKYNSDDLIKFQETLHSIESSYRKLVETNVSNLEELKDKLIFNKNNISIYKADGPGDCITLGEGQSLCISQPTSKNAYYTYRNRSQSTFYFVYDRNFKEDHPLSLVVVDVQKNTIELTDKNNDTGTIDIYEDDNNKYLDYLRSKGVPIDKLVNFPFTKEEISENKKLGDLNQDLDWFKQLSREEKFKYISRYHQLTEEQILEIIKDKKLFNKYLNTGNPLSVNIVKSLNSNELTTYKRIRERILKENKIGNMVISDILLGQENKILDILDILDNTVRYSSLEDFIYILNNYKENITDLHINNALSESSWYNKFNISKYILDNYKNKKYFIYDDNINYVLIQGFIKENFDIIKYIENNFKDKIAEKTVNSILDHISEKEYNLDIAKYFIITYKDKIPDEKINLVLNKLKSFNNIELLKTILDNCKDKITNKNINYILNWASQYGKTEFIKYILINYENEMTDENINNSLDWALIYDYNSIINVLTNIKEKRHLNKKEASSNWFKNI